MDPGAFLHAAAAGELEQRLEVVEVRVDAALRDEAEQVDGRPSLARALEGTGERPVREERAVANRRVQTLQVLEEDPSGADREMAHLRVAHLAGRQPDGLAGGREPRVRVLAPDAVEHRRPRELDRVSGTRRRAPPAVEDDERYEVDAARQIAAKESGSSDAPPTSAPSIEDRERSSAAFSGLTDPPYRTGRWSTPLMNACASSACSGVAVLPVPIAHTGS